VFPFSPETATAGEAAIGKKMLLRKKNGALLTNTIGLNTRCIVKNAQGSL
jgi:hypothetical protein